MIAAPIATQVPRRFETDRLVVKLLEEADAESLTASIHQSWPELHQRMCWAASEEPQSFEATVAYIMEATERIQNAERFPFQIYGRQSREHLGCIGLHHIEWTVPKFEIGYWLNTRFWGYGYMTEAVRILSRLLIDVIGSARVEIRCDHDNLPSAAVARRAGFQHEARLINDRRHHLTGELGHTDIFVLLQR